MYFVDGTKDLLLSYAARVHVPFNPMLYGAFVYIRPMPRLTPNASGLAEVWFLGCDEYWKTHREGQSTGIATSAILWLTRFV